MINFKEVERSDNFNNRKNPNNPYIAGPAIQEGLGFFGRQDALRWVASELRNGNHNRLVLFGQRRIGKTSLLFQLKRTLAADEFLPVYFDLQNYAKDPLGELLADLADELAKAAGMEPVERDKFDDRGRFFINNFLPQFRAVLGSRRPILLLDEFDVLDQLATQELSDTIAAKSFFGWLSRLDTKAPWVVCILTLGRRADDIKNFDAIAKSSLRKELWVLDRQSTEKLIRQAEDKGTLSFTNEAIARILDLTNGHPYFTQLLCQHIWQNADRDDLSTTPLVGIAEVESAISGAFEKGQMALEWIWKGLSRPERIYASALAKIATATQPIEEEDVLQCLVTEARRLYIHEVQAALPYLLERKILEYADKEKRQYRFAIEIFRLWVKERQPLDRVKNELDHLNPSAEKLFERGKGFFKRGQWHRAESDFRDALKAYPEHFQARLLLGETLLKLKRFDDAVEELKKAYQQDRDETKEILSRALLSQARAHEEAGRETEAEKSYARIIEISPEWKEWIEKQEYPYPETAFIRIRLILARRGDAALKRGEFHRARKAYAAIPNEFKLAEVDRQVREQEEQAQKQEQEKEWGSAFKLYEDLIKNDPDNKDKLESWITSLERCRTILISSLEPKAEEHEENRRWEEASDLYRQLVNLAIHETAKKNLWQKALERSEGHVQASNRTSKKLKEREAQAKRYEESGQWQKAIHEYEALIRLSSDEDSKSRWRAAIERCEAQRAFNDLSPAEKVVQANKERIHLSVKQLETFNPLFKEETNEKDRSTYRAEIESCLKDLFEKGVDALKEEQWENAITAFEAVAECESDYKGEKYRADYLLERAKNQQGYPTENSRVVRRVGIGILVLVLLGTFYIFMPSNLISQIPEIALAQSTETPTRLPVLAIPTEVIPTATTEILPTATTEILPTATVEVMPTSTKPITEPTNTPTASTPDFISPNTVDELEVVQTLLKDTQGVTSMALMPDLSTWARAVEGHTIDLTHTRQELLSTQVLEEHNDDITALAFSSNGKMLASGSNDSNIHLWQASDGMLIQTLTEHTARITSLAFSPDGTLVASGALDNSVRVWQVSDGTLVETLTGHTGAVDSVVFSPNGEVLASGSADETVRLWQCSNWKWLKTLRGHKDRITSVIFSPDGTLVASGAVDNTVRVWRVLDYAFLRELKGHANWVTSIAFSPDSSLLLSGSHDKTVRLWNVSNGRHLRTFEKHLDKVIRVAFYRNGKKFVSGLSNGTLQIWGLKK